MAVLNLNITPAFGQRARWGGLWLMVVAGLGVCGLPARAEEAARAEHAPSAAAHADTEPASIGLVELLRAAQRNPPGVLTALAALKRVEAEQHAAEGAYLPRATGDATLGLLYDNRRVLPNSVDEADASRINSLNLMMAAGMTLDWAALDMARSHNVDAAEASTRREGWAVAARQRVAILAASELYLRALAATALVEDASLNLARRTQQQASIAELARAGVRPPVDATRASVESVAAKYVLEMRKVDELAAFAALAVAVGQSPERGLRPLPLEHDPFAGPASLEEASRLARAERPEIKLLREQLHVQEATVHGAKAGRLPSAGLYATGQLTYYKVFRGDGIDGNQYNANGGLYLRWNGADAQLVRRHKVALARIAEAQRELESTELSIRAEVVDASYGVRRAQAQLDQATQVLEAARATRAAQQERYGAGTASLLELLDAEALEQTARRARIEAARDLDLARARLLAVCGTLNRLLQGG